MMKRTVPKKTLKKMMKQTSAMNVVNLIDVIANSRDNRPEYG